jgi:predicted Zn-ribbon and HTH transcriptional regulator
MKTVTILIADAEMRADHSLLQPYDNDFMHQQLQSINWQKRWLEEKGYTVRLHHIEGEGLDTRYSGLAEEERERLFDALMAAGEEVWETIPVQAVVDVIKPGYKICQRCGHEWFPRSKKRSAQCPNPKCHSTAWDRPRTGNEPGPKPKSRN